MTRKQTIEMLTNWVKEYNPKAVLEECDPRIGKRYQIVMYEPNCKHTFSDCLTLNEMEQYLMGVRNADFFKKHLADYA